MKIKRIPVPKGLVNAIKHADNSSCLETLYRELEYHIREQGYKAKVNDYGVWIDGQKNHWGEVEDEYELVLLT